MSNRNRNRLFDQKADERLHQRCIMDAFETRFRHPMFLPVSTKIRSLWCCQSFVNGACSIRERSIVPLLLFEMEM